MLGHTANIISMTCILQRSGCEFRMCLFSAWRFGMFLACWKGMVEESNRVTGTVRARRGRRHERQGEVGGRAEVDR